MAKSEYRYEPDYAVPPGLVLADMLETRQISHAEFARRCGRSAKLVSEIVAGKAPLEPVTALQFERVLGMDASLWLNIEASYRLHRAKETEERELQASAEWASRFPIKYLVKLGWIENPADKVDAARKLLVFFGVGTVQAWEQRYSGMGVAYRRSPSIKASPQALAAWLRIGELLAEHRECAEFDRSTFVSTLRTIRGLTALTLEEFLPDMCGLCSKAGVAFTLVPPLPKTALGGAARWLSPRKALIQQSLRHRSNDHFWFTFFHEAAHILLHTKKGVFVDEGSANGNSEDREADAWAANFLIPSREFVRFAARGFPGEAAIIDFASEQGIAPGIVVGMLQHENMIEWRQYNHLKDRYEWILPAAEETRAS